MVHDFEDNMLVLTFKAKGAHGSQLRAGSVHRNPNNESVVTALIVHDAFFSVWAFVWVCAKKSKDFVHGFRVSVLHGAISKLPSVLKRHEHRSKKILNNPSWFKTSGRKEEMRVTREMFSRRAPSIDSRAKSDNFRAARARRRDIDEDFFNYFGNSTRWHSRVAFQGCMSRCHRRPF
ncbi:unnamed protein product [Leptidea sinapis]|uniref:Uncharacterized protein n=1 Tax=Leptidea sinapis TaxID=189913 RepID=A0A5E4QIT8_9NEOP|nr:unnamed protein product [Leptidea sinapis]